VAVRIEQAQTTCTVGHPDPASGIHKQIGDPLLPMFGVGRNGQRHALKRIRQRIEQGEVRRVRTNEQIPGTIPSECRDLVTGQRIRAAFVTVHLHPSAIEAVEAIRGAHPQVSTTIHGQRLHMVAREPIAHGDGAQAGRHQLGGRFKGEGHAQKREQMHSG
jgi:hypothetical protein